MNRTVLISLKPLLWAKVKGNRLDVGRRFEQACGRSYDALIDWVHSLNTEVTVQQSRAEATTIPLVNVTAESAIIEQLIDESTRPEWVAAIADDSVRVSNSAPLDAME